MPNSTAEIYRSNCPISTTLDIVGDRWTLIIVRDMVTGKTRFAEFLESPERITTNILTDRLRAMVESGLAEKRAYQDRPPRFEYTLTPQGRALIPLLQDMCRWANAFRPETWTPPKSFMDQVVE